VIPGRDASLSDLLTNTGGGLLGALLVDRVPLLLSPSPRRAMRLLCAGLAAWIALLAVSGWLLMPHFGDSEIEAAAATIPAPEVFTGRVLEVRRAGERQPHGGPLPDSAAVREALRRGELTLEARVTTGTASKGRRWLYMIGERGVPRLDLSEDDRDVLFGVPARAQELLLATPSLLLPDGLPSDSGRTAMLRAQERNRVLRLSSSYDGVTRSAALTLTPMLGWTLIAPFDLGVGPQVPFVTGLLLALVMVPLGHWARRADRAAPASLLLAAGVGVGLGVVPRLEGFPPVPLTQWAAALAGIAAGWALSPAAAYLERRCGSPSTAESSSS